VATDSTVPGADSLRPGDPLVVTERWRGHLWSAVPHTFVASDDGALVTFLPAGALSAYASSRGVPGREHLPRGERKLLAMQTCVYTVVEVPHHFTPLATLHFFRPGSWARVNAGWTSDLSTFLGWYVNFEVPYQVVDDGLETMDLVLDMIVKPDLTWWWKDRDEFDDAVLRGVLDPDLAGTLETEASRITDLIARRDGPFRPTWSRWRPDRCWSAPSLPAHLRAGGVAWER
jgi:protein associated with RNAse G/E